MDKRIPSVRYQTRLLRLRAGLTQEKLAELAAISVETVQRLERTGYASISTVSAIANALGVGISEIMEKRKPLVIACMSEKGGVGRTTLTFNLSVLLAVLGKSVCAVQIDDHSGLYNECRIHRRRRLPHFSTCMMPEPRLIADWLDAAQSYSHILVDGTRYRPDINAVLIAKADVIVVPIVHVAMDEGPLDLLMSQIALVRNVNNAPILLVFNRQWPNDPGIVEDLRRVERRYGRSFPSALVARRKTFEMSEDGSLFGPLNSPITTPRARGARKACQELANLWTVAERIVSHTHP